MSRTLLPVLFLVACGPGTIKLAGDTAAAIDDTGMDDTSTDSDTQTDTDTDVEDTDVEPVMVPDYSVWNATRRFYYDYSEYGYECDETVTETGDAIPEGTSDYEALHELCGICDYFYEVEPDRESVCDGYIGLSTTWRGVILTDDAAAVYFYRESDGGLEEYAADESAGFDGTTIDYGYQYELFNFIEIDVSGAVTYPLIEQE